MKIYIDFDGTLFDTDKYMNASMSILNEYGIDSFMFNKVKKDLFGDKNLFNLNMMIDFFIEKHNINKEVKNKIDNLLNNSYLYTEITECLDILMNCGYKLYLLTYGDKEFQKTKIDSTNISKYFKEIIITNKDKSELNLDYKNSIFIDNNPVVIERLYSSQAKVLIRIKRHSDRYSKTNCNICGIIECGDFNEIVKCLKGGFNNE